MKHFKTMKAMREATEEELLEVEGMTVAAAKSLKEFLDKDE